MAKTFAVEVDQRGARVVVWVDPDPARDPEFKHGFVNEDDAVGWADVINRAMRGAIKHIDEGTQAPLRSPTRGACPGGGPTCDH